MEKMKRAAMLVAAVVALSAVLAAGVSANAPGSVRGNLLYTDITAYINGFRIPNYAVDSQIGVSSIVFLRDLSRYGFEVTYDFADQVAIVRLRHADDPDFVFDPIPASYFELHAGRPGDFAGHHLHTNVRVIVDGTELPQHLVFNIGGAAAVPLEALPRSVGSVFWDAGAREIRMTLATEFGYRIRISPTTSIPNNMIQIGEDRGLQARDRVGNVLLGAGHNLRWSSANPAVVSVDRYTGAIRGVSAGSARITATAIVGGWDIIGHFDITVASAVRVTGIVIDPPTATIGIGGVPTQLRAVLTPAGASDAITWRVVSPPASPIININPATGQVTGVRVGTATVEAQTSGGLTARSTVIVSEAAQPAVIRLSPANARIGLGEHVQLSVVAVPDDAANRAVTWESSNPAVASVSSTGRVSALWLPAYADSVTVTVTGTTAAGTAATAEVRVQRAATRNLASLTVSPAIATIEQGESVTFAAAVYPVGVSGAGITWASSDAGIATVDRSTGLVRGVTPGNATITATAPNGVIGRAEVNVTLRAGNFLGIQTGVNYGPFGITTLLPQQPGGNMQSVHVDTFEFTRFDRVGTGGGTHYQVDMRIRGRSTDDRAEFYVRFLDSAGNTLQELRISRVVPYNQHFDIVENNRFINLTTGAGAASVEFVSLTGNIAMQGQASGGPDSTFTAGMTYAGFPTVPSFGMVNFANLAVNVTALMSVDAGGRTVITYNFSLRDFRENEHQTRDGAMTAAVDAMYLAYIRELARQGFNAVGTPRADVNIYQQGNVRVTVTRAGASVAVIIENM